MKTKLNPFVQFTLRRHISPNYPNPFNPETKIEFALPQKIFVQLEIYNVIGQRIKTLLAEEKPAGYYSVTWNARDETGKTLPTGVYFARMRAGDFIAVRKMLLLQ